jgi:hypothetical protein
MATLMIIVTVPPVVLLPATVRIPASTGLALVVRLPIPPEEISSALVVR